MLWLRTGVLSDKQINRLLGEKLYIWPFNTSNLKGSTYNLTASIIARSLNTDELLTNDNKEIIIRAGDTALIETEESLFVEKDTPLSFHHALRILLQMYA